MNGKWRFIFLFVIIVILFKTFQYFEVFSHKNLTTKPDLAGRNSENENQKVKVSVYYEALCPDSKFFITMHLLPTYESLKDCIELDFVPYGKAKTAEHDGQLTFYCQHGSVECFANKIHACVIDLVKDPIKQLKYVSCMITDNMIPDDAGEKCGQELDIDYAPIIDCANGDRGSQLLKHYGERTDALNPAAKFIPTIELNDSQSIVPQSAILKDLLKAVCQILHNQPKECPG